MHHAKTAILLILFLSFICPASFGQQKLASMDPDGYNQKLVIDMPVGMARWSADMSKIVFGSNESTTGRNEIFLYDIGTGEVAQLTAYGHYYGQSRPFFANDNEIWWNWHGPVAGNSEIYSMNLDGSNKTALTDFLSESKQSAGCRIAGSRVFYAKQNRSWSPTKEIYTANLDFSGETRLTFNNNDDQFSDVNSDGSLIVFSRYEASNGYSPPTNVYVLRPGIGETRLTSVSGNDVCDHLVLSPDGTKIAYSYREGSRRDIWVMDIDGGNKINITNTPEYDELPSDWKNGRILYSTDSPIENPAETGTCYTTLWSKSEIPEDTLAEVFPNAFSEYPSSDQPYYDFVDTDSEFGHHIAWRQGCLIPETRGKYIHQAQAAAWYRVLATNMGSAATLEYRYFVFDVVTNEKTENFAINYQHQWINNYIGELREWKYSTPMPIDYQLGPNEILGFYTVFHTHGANNVYYEYEYHYGSTQTPSFIDVWYSSGENPSRYYVSTECGQDEELFGVIAGTVIHEQSGMSSVPINLYNINGSMVEAAYTDEDGRYGFEDIAGGSYYVSIETPLGFQPLSETEVPVEISGNDVTINFELGDATSGKLRSYWWWKDQLEQIHDGETPFSGLTADSFNYYGTAIYDHFLDRQDGHEIKIDGLTYLDDPGIPLDYSYFDTFFYDNKDTDNRTKIIKNLLTIMLNVASARINQNAVVSNDGATISQAITHYASVLESGVYSWKDWYYPMKIHSGYIIPGGIIPLETPRIMYKEQLDNMAENLPSQFTLSQNYPNPFNPETRISFALPERCDVKLDVYNIVGQKITTVTEGSFEAGNHTVTWDGSSEASGVYFYKLTAGENVQSRKMLLLK